MSDPTDDRIRQVMHELADSAPPPPAWEHLQVPPLRLADPPRRAPWLLAAAAIALVVGIVGAAVVLRDRGDRVTTDTPVISPAPPATVIATSAVAPTVVAPSVPAPATSAPSVPSDTAEAPVVPTTIAAPTTPAAAAEGGVELVRRYLAELAAGRFDDAAGRLGASNDWRSRPDLAALTLASDESELPAALAAWCASGALCAEPSSVDAGTNLAGSPVISATYEVAGTILTGTFATVEPAAVRGVPPLAGAAGLAVLASGADVGVVVARLPGEELVTWNDGALAELGVATAAWVWSDGTFVYREDANPDADGVPQPSTTATRLDGDVVCTVEGRMHRLRTVDDGFVASVERVPDAAPPIGSEQTVPNFAVDCATGETTAIDPISWTREGGSRGITRVGDRTFTYEGDAEGNADMTNEQGVSIDGDEYAGYHTFSPDGDRVVYGDFTGAPGPHATARIRSRDTTTGELLWTIDFAEPFGSLSHTGDHVVVAHPPPLMVDPVAPWETTSWIEIYDAERGELLLTVPTVLELIYLG